MIDWEELSIPKQTFKPWIEEELDEILADHSYQQKQFLVADDDGMPLPPGYCA